MPRTTSHSVCPSATVPEVEGGAPAAPLASALASPGAGAIPGQPPSALTRSSAVTGLSGLSGGVSIETLRMNSWPERENHCASFESRSDCSISAVPEQPAISGASVHNASSRFRLKILSRTMNSVPPGTALAGLSNCPTITLRHDRGRAQARLRKPQIITNCARSLFPPLPAAPFVSLPVGGLKAARLATLPGVPRRRQRIVIVAVEHQHHPIVALGVGGERRLVNQETDIGAVEGALRDRQDDRLILRIARAPGRMRQKGIGAVGP